MKSENDFFNELIELSQHKGFWSVVAYTCLNDSFFMMNNKYLNKPSKKDYKRVIDQSVLSRAEISTLVAIACKRGFDQTRLCEAELKESYLQIKEIFKNIHMLISSKAEIGLGFAIREAVFYSGEGATKNQYQELSRIRYKLDNQWLKNNKGFSISEAVEVIKAIELIQLRKAGRLLAYENIKTKPDLLSVFSVELIETAKECGLKLSTVKAVVQAFSSKPINEVQQYSSIDDFNHKQAFPIVAISESKFLLLQVSNLWEAVYENPFFWFYDDDKYKGIASDNRGRFTEEFTANRLRLIFGEKNVLTNVDIFDGKKKIAEIDVLVVFAETAIVVQAKSKKLTIAARKGCYEKIRDDFSKAIQSSYDQAYNCSKLLQKKDLSYRDSTGSAVLIQHEFKCILPVCLTSSHYPSSSIQNREFLQYRTTGIIKKPYITDIMLIDVITEILPSPLWFIDYLKKRSNYGNNIISNNEVIVFSNYIKNGLLPNKDLLMFMLDQTPLVDVFSEFSFRKMHPATQSNPKGFIADQKKKYIGCIIGEIEGSDCYIEQQVGHFLLSMHPSNVKKINNKISRMVNEIKKGVANYSSHHYDLDECKGLTIQCNEYDKNIAREKLDSECLNNAQKHRANTWFGICFSLKNGKVRFYCQKEN